MTNTSGRAVTWIVLLLVILPLAAAGIIYLQASRVPEQYQPPELSQAQREQWVKDFANRLAKFNEYAQNPEPFSWSINQDRVNNYLASMDEIVAVMPGRKPGEVNQAMARLGLAEPAVVLDDGAITVMIRSTEYNKVLSAKLDLQPVGDGQLKVSLAKTRIGRLPLPPDIAKDKLHGLKTALAGRLQPGQDEEKLEGPAHIAALLATILQAIDGPPISLKGTWDGRVIKIRKITIDDGRLTLEIDRVPPG